MTFIIFGKDFDVFIPQSKSQKNEIFKNTLSKGSYKTPWFFH